MTITRVGTKTYEIQTKLIRNDEKNRFEKELNDFLSELYSDELIDIKYNTTPLAVAPNVEYSALVIYKMTK